VLYNGISLEETQQLLARMMDWSGLSPGPGNSRAGSNISSQLKQQHLQPSVAAADLAAEACRRSLAQQLQFVVTQCSNMFERPLMAISPSIQPVSQLLLLPAAAVGSGGSSAASSSTSQQVAVALPLLQPKHLMDSQVYVACLAHPLQTGEAAASGQHTYADKDLDVAVQQQSLLIVQIAGAPSVPFGQQLAHDTLAARPAQAVLLQLEASQRAVAWEFYAKQKLALLTQTCMDGEFLYSGAQASLEGQLLAINTTGLS